MEICVQIKERRQTEVPEDKSSVFIVDFEQLRLRYYKLVLKKPAFYLSANFVKTKLRNVTDKEL